MQLAQSVYCVLEQHKGSIFIGDKLGFKVGVMVGRVGDHDGAFEGELGFDVGRQVGKVGIIVEGATGAFVGLVGVAATLHVS